MAKYVFIPTALTATSTEIATQVAWTNPDPAQKGRAFGQNAGIRLKELDPSYARRKGEQVKAKMGRPWLTEEVKAELALERAQFLAQVKSSSASWMASVTEELKRAKTHLLEVSPRARRKAERLKEQADRRAQRGLERAAKKAAKEAAAAERRKSRQAQIAEVWKELKAGGKKLSASAIALAYFLAAQRAGRREDLKTGRKAGQAKVWVSRRGVILGSTEVNMAPDTGVMNLALAGASKTGYYAEILQSISSYSSCIFVKIGGKIFTLDDFLYKDRQKFNCSVEIEIVLG